MLATTYAQEGALLGMEEVLLDSADDLCLHKAYASAHLCSRDPAVMARGRFIEAQLRQEDPACRDEERRKLDGKKRKLLKEFGRAWLGDLACYLVDAENYTFELWRGWLDRVLVPELRADFLGRLARSPRARLLRTLEIDGDGPDGVSALRAIASAPWLAGLKELRVGPRVIRQNIAEAVRELARA